MNYQDLKIVSYFAGPVEVTGSPFGAGDGITGSPLSLDTVKCRELTGGPTTGGSGRQTRVTAWGKTTGFVWRGRVREGVPRIGVREKGLETRARNGQPDRI